MDAKVAAIYTAVASLLMFSKASAADTVAAPTISPSPQAGEE
jgi:hypothetical protein